MVCWDVAVVCSGGVVICSDCACVWFWRCCGCAGFLSRVLRMLCCLAGGKVSCLIRLC